MRELQVSCCHEELLPLHHPCIPCPVPKCHSPCVICPMCPKLNHHSFLPKPQDKSCHLFLHLLTNTSSFPPSTYPSAHTAIVLCHVSVCHLPFGSPPLPLHACAQARCPIPLRHTGLCDREGLVGGAEAYPQSIVFTCTLRQIQVRHSCIVHSRQHQGLNRLAIRNMWQLD